MIMMPRTGKIEYIVISLPAKRCGIMYFEFLARKRIIKLTEKLEAPEINLFIQFQSRKSEIFYEVRSIFGLIMHSVII